MAERDPLVGIYRRLRVLSDTSGEHHDRLTDVERVMAELIEKLSPILTDYEYDKRRRADRRKVWSDWRVIIASIGGLVVLAESVVQLLGH